FDAILLADFFTADDQRSSAIVDARRVTGSDHAISRQRAQAGEGGHVAGWARVLVLINYLVRLLAPLGYFDRQDFFGEETLSAGLFVQCLAAGSVGISFFTGDAQISGDVIRRLRHGVVTVLGLHLGVGEARTYGAVEGAEFPGIGALALGDDEGRAAHAFNATGNEEFAFAGFHRTGGVQNGGQTGTAQAVDGNAGDFLWQAG